MAISTLDYLNREHIHSVTEAGFGCYPNAPNPLHPGCILQCYDGQEGLHVDWNTIREVDRAAGPTRIRRAAERTSC